MCSAISHLFSPTALEMCNYPLLTGFLKIEALKGEWLTEGTQLPPPEVKTQCVLSGCPPETGSPCGDTQCSSPKQSVEVSQREEGPRGGDRILGRKAEAQRNVWGNSL